MKDIVDQIWNTLKPPRAYCWQTLFCLSLFSGVMSAIARGFLGEVIAIVGYLLLIISIAWIGIKNRWQSTPWIVAVSICLFFWKLFGIKPQILALLWFPLAAIIASLAHFITRNLEFKVPHSTKRQAVVILLETQILMACWLQFSFLCHDWLQKYPSLLSEDFSESKFVITLDISPSQPRVFLILEEMRKLLEQRFNDRPWGEVNEQLKASEGASFLPNFQSQVLENLNFLKENDLWEIESQLSSTSSEYQVKLIAQWLGPRSNRTLANKSDRGETICNIRPQNDLARVTCNISRNSSFTTQK
ncbi:DUF5357 family protein [Spirulina sp. 06S082]|uniref:DUF5357 family protein n=1 Tax=Spirulina sp. 06S082 TaxID=3110248 RepID=UPI002B1EDFF8|nr:DUF5357 family protein [Spirulina sp. 06S082]MEA5471039.1 DUF5357 family protein [Spirulina sp. 06S082]